VDLAGVGAGLGLANFWSVILAFPAEKRAGIPFPRALDGYNGQAVGSALGSIVAVAVVITPVVIAMVVTAGSAAAARLPALMLAGAAYGAILCWAGVQIAARSPAAKLPSSARSPPAAGSET
jgi:ABC-2 type transport system permease protein